MPAQEVRSLSALSGQTGTRMAERVAVINSATVATRQAAQATAAQDDADTRQSQDTIAQVLAALQEATGAIANGADALRVDSHGIQNEIDAARVQLQFQDRVSQIMSHVRSNIEKLPAALAPPPAAAQVLQPLDAAPLLAQLGSS